MEYRTPDASGCAVSTFALGTTTFGDRTGKAEAFAQLDMFTEAAGTSADIGKIRYVGLSNFTGKYVRDEPGAVLDVAGDIARTPGGPVPQVALASLAAGPAEQDIR